MSGGSIPHARPRSRYQIPRDRTWLSQYSINNRLVKKPPRWCICPICANLAIDAVIFSPCGHLLCRNCDKRRKRCPTCHEMRGGTSAKSIRVRSKILSLEVFCRNRDCKAVFPLKNLAKHQKRCWYMRETCSFCEKRFQRSHWETPTSHKTWCPLLLILERAANMKEKVSMIEVANQALESQVRQLEDEGKVWRWRCNVSNQLLRENRCKRSAREIRNEGERKHSVVESDEKTIVLETSPSGDVSEDRYSEEGREREESSMSQSELVI